MGVLAAERIREVLDQSGSAEQCCRALVDAVNAQGSPDNVTVVVARFRDVQELKPSEQATAAAVVEEGSAGVATEEMPVPFTVGAAAAGPALRRAAAG